MQITLKGRRVKGLSYSQCGTEAVFTNKMQITMIILGTKNKKGLYLACVKILSHIKLIIIH